MRFAKINVKINKLKINKYLENRKPNKNENYL